MPPAAWSRCRSRRLRPSAASPRSCHLASSIGARFACSRPVTRSPISTSGSRSAAPVARRIKAAVCRRVGRRRRNDATRALPFRPCASSLRQRGSDGASDAVQPCRPAPARRGARLCCRHRGPGACERAGAGRPARARAREACGGDGSAAPGIGRSAAHRRGAVAPARSAHGRGGSDRFVYGWGCDPRGCREESLFLAFDTMRERAYLLVVEDGAPILFVPPRTAPWPETLAEPLHAFHPALAAALRFAPAER